MTDEDENALSFQLSAIYNYFSQKHSLSVELFHYHDVWNADYSGNCELWQHLWKGESLAFFSYNFQASRRLSLKPASDWIGFNIICMETTVLASCLLASIRMCNTS